MNEQQPTIPASTIPPPVQVKPQIQNQPDFPSVNPSSTAAANQQQSSSVVDSTANDSDLNNITPTIPSPPTPIQPNSNNPADADPIHSSSPKNDQKNESNEVDQKASETPTQNDENNTKQNSTNQNEADSSNDSNNSSGNPDDPNCGPQPKQTSITLLSRGLKLLSISHLRQLLRDYSLPTGGNKMALIQRLILFLETFGPTQQTMVVQFSVNLKKLLSVDNGESEEPPIDEAQMQLLPPGIAGKVLKTSPSCLYETTEHPLAFGPVMIQAKTPSDVFEFTLLNPAPNCIPILQFAPVFLDSPLKTISFLLGQAYVVLSEPTLWCTVSEFICKNGTFQVKQTEPSVPVIAVVRWLKKIPIPRIVDDIVTRDSPEPKEFLTSQQSSNGQNSNSSNSNSAVCSSKGICPLTKKIVSIPARGTNCNHGECFDLTGYVCSAVKLNRWVCPICMKALSAEDLRVDGQYFFKVKP